MREAGSGAGVYCLAVTRRSSNKFNGCFPPRTTPPCRAARTPPWSPDEELPAVSPSLVPLAPQSSVLK